MNQQDQPPLAIASIFIISTAQLLNPLNSLRVATSQQLLRIDRIISLHVVRFARLKFVFRRADDYPKHFLFGVIEYLTQKIGTDQHASYFGTVNVLLPTRIRPVPSTTK